MPACPRPHLAHDALNEYLSRHATQQQRSKKHKGGNGEPFGGDEMGKKGLTSAGGGH